METQIRNTINRWLSNALTWCQVLLYINAVCPYKSLAINFATLLLHDDPKEPIHDCLETLAIIQGIHSNMKDFAITTRDVALCTDRQQLCSRKNEICKVSHGHKS